MLFWRVLNYLSNNTKYVTVWARICVLVAVWQRQSLVRGRPVVPHKPQLSLSCHYLSAVNTDSTCQQVQQTSIIHIQLGSNWSLLSCNCPATSTAVNKWLADAIVGESPDTCHRINKSRCKQTPFSVLKIPTMLVHALVMMSCLVFRLNTRWNHRCINSLYTGALWPLMADLRRS